MTKVIDQEVKTETPSPPRPNRHDKAVVAIAAEELAKLICEDWDHKGATADWIELLTKAAHHWDDGYQLAKELDDRHCVGANAALVDVLENAYSILSDAHEFALKQWTSLTGYAPSFTDKQRATHVRLGAGYVNGIQAEKATYYFVPDSEAASGKFKQGGGYVVTDDALTAI